jgi:peptide/nickel transport system permease protein
MTARTPALAAAPVRSQGYWSSVWRRLLRDRVSVLCMVVLAMIVLAAIFAPLLTPYDPAVGTVVQRLKPPLTPGHILGTDELGRDMLTRLLFGARMSLMMGILPVLFALLIGGALGTLAGFVGGWTNTIIMRATDVIFAFPSILLAVAIAGALGSGFVSALFALTIVLIPPLVRVTESATTQVRSLDFVDAARASGAGGPTIIRVHILGNILGPVIVYSTSLLSVAIIMAAGLSFIGLGVKPPTPEWGLMLNTLRAAIYSQPLLAALPGVFIFAVSLSFNLLSDGLRSAMDMS